MAEKNVIGGAIAAPLRQGGVHPTTQQQNDDSHQPGVVTPQQLAGESAGAEASLQEETSMLSQSCQKVMSANPVCCLPTDTIDVAARLMVTEDIGALPVVIDLTTFKLLGIVTDRDLAVKAVAEGCDPTSTTVEEVMTYEPVTCRSEDSLEQVLGLMAEHQVRRIPVVDDNGFLVGIIAQADIATRVPLLERTAHVVAEISKSTLEEEELHEGQH